LPLLTAWLLGAVLAPTDPATLVPIFSQVKIRERVAQTVISESAFNDATGAILTFTVLGFVMGSAAEPSAGSIALVFAREAGVGILVGAGLGYLVADLVAHERRGILADFAPVTAIVGVTGAFTAAGALHGSGFMAVFVFGLMFGNRESFGLKLSGRAAHHLEEFKATGALVLRLLIFMLLGTQVNFTLMSQVALPAALLVLVFMFIARPLAVFICAAPDRRAKWSIAELVFMCWTRETGVIPAALAGLLLGQRVPGAETVAAVTFVAILMTILIQAPTTRALARRLGLLTSGQT
jgi:cell volume regulation protein A